MTTLVLMVLASVMVLPLVVDLKRPAQDAHIVRSGKRHLKVTHFTPTV